MNGTGEILKDEGSLSTAFGLESLENAMLSSREHV